MKKSILISTGILSIILIALGIWSFIDNHNKVSDYFPDNTAINGVDCSGLSMEEFNQAITQKWNSQEFVLNADDKYVGMLTDIDFEYKVSGSIRDALIHSGMNPLFTWIAKEFHPFDAAMKITKVNTGFTKQFNSLEIMNNESRNNTTNAFIDMSTPTLPIVAEKYGSNIDRDKLLKKIFSAIESGEFQIDTNESDLYVTPKVISSDSDLLAKQALYRKYLAFQITYDFGYNQTVMTPKVISELLGYENGKVVVYDDKIRDYIKKLAKKYDSAGMSRYFYANGVKVSVYGGNYGYLIDQAAEIEWLTYALQKGKSATRSPKYTPTERSHSNSKYGSSYVEIDLAEQHLWIYKNDVLVLSTPVVTGNVAKETTTPAGSYQIYFMQRDRVLKGDDWDGTTYETPVAYWMAFNRSIGLHDAPWRHKFGGAIYKENGSHGCINMPPYMAKAAYSLINIGFPVIVHY
jgi:lipoprotein-anchoring transpeptidase ErfK/SrfK